ncbi:MAG: adenylate kinase [Nitrospirae bacterium]|nr:adenylate kinase [Fimbriimonadaceae bacterium]
MKVAVFGKPGGGKSTLGKKIADATGLPLVQLDLIQFKPGGARVPDQEFLRLHAAVLAQPRWVLDGFGTRQTFEAMVREADVLVYVERASWVHYWWVTKRFVISPLVKPLGWPPDSPMWESTISSYRNLRSSPRFWSAEFKEHLMARRPAKHVFVVRSRSTEAEVLRELQSIIGARQEGPQ